MPSGNLAMQAIWQPRIYIAHSLLSLMPKLIALSKTPLIAFHIHYFFLYFKLTFSSHCNLYNPWYQLSITACIFTYKMYVNSLTHKNDSDNAVFSKTKSQTISQGNFLFDVWTRPVYNRFQTCGTGSLGPPNFKGNSFRMKGKVELGRVNARLSAYFLAYGNIK